MERTMKRIYKHVSGYKESRYKQESQEVQHEAGVKSKLDLFKKYNSKNTIKRIQQVLKQIAESNLICTHEYLIQLTDGKMALVISYILYMENKLTDKDYQWFVLKYNDIICMTGVTRRTIHATMKWLHDFGIIDIEKRGVPAMQHYKLYKDILVGEIADCLLGELPLPGIQI